MEIGTVEGAVNTEKFRFEAHRDIEKFDFVAVKANVDEADWMLAQIDEVEKQPLDDDEKVDKSYKTVASANIIGYRVQGLLKKPRSVIKPDSLVYQADQELISECLGLNEDGLYTGLLVTNPGIKVYLDPEELYKHIAVLAKTGAGKCVAPGTEVLMEDGSLHPIQDIYEQHRSRTIQSNEEEAFVKLDGATVQSLNSDMEASSADAVFGYRKKADKIVTIETASGRSISVSKDHPLLCAQRGSTAFQKAEELGEGDRIAISRRITSSSDALITLSNTVRSKSRRLKNERITSANNHQNALDMNDAGRSLSQIVKETGENRGTVENWLYKGYQPADTGKDGLVVSKKGKQVTVPAISPELMEFFAMIIAEGTEQQTHYYRLLFTNENERLLNRFKSLTSNLFDLEAKHARDNTVYVDSNALATLFQEMGYRTGQRSRTKQIPNIVMQADRSCKAQFLQTYFDCDGWMDSHEAVVSTASKDIANKISYLLLEFGIPARIRQKRKQASNSNHEGDLYYEVAVSGIDNLTRFHRQIGFQIPRKKEKLEAYLETKELNTNTDTFPVDGQKIRRAREEKDLSQRELSNLINMSQMIISRYENENREPSRQALHKIGKALDIDEYTNLANADVLWDRITSITVQDNPHEYVYDLTVEDDHTFIAGFGGIINHNSYSTGVLIEELLDKDYPVVIVDPHGEYHTLEHDNRIEEKLQKKYSIDPSSYQVEEYSPNTELNENALDISFSSRNMDAREIQQVVPTNLTNSQLGVLYSALKELKKREEYDLNDIIDRCMEEESKAKWNLVNLLETVRDSGLFADDPTDLSNMIQRGQATVLNLRGVDPEDQERVVYKFAKETFEMRKRGNLKPFFMILEEAHNFVPEKGMKKAICSDILRKIASEGRKFGLGMGVISQRPANVAKNILSQCNTQLIMRVTNPNDLSAISRSFEGVTSEVEDFITSLSPGVGLVLGKEYPVMTDIRVRRSLHGGETKQLSEEDDEPIEEGTSSTTAAAAEEREDQQDEMHHYEEPGEDAGKTGESAAASKQQKHRLRSFTPSVSRDEARKRLENPRKAFYPVYIVDTTFGKLLIDGMDGSIKDRDLSLTDDADKVLEQLASGSLTKEELQERTGMDKKAMKAVLKGLKQYNLVEKQGKQYVTTATGILGRRIMKVNQDDAKRIEPDIAENQVKNIVQDELETEPDNIEMVYYPYYTTQDTVLDAVLDEKV